MITRVFFYVALLSTCMLFEMADGVAAPGKSKHNQTRITKPSQKELGPYRGWDYLVSKLKKDGVPSQQIDQVYRNSKFPAFTFVPFAVAPRESSALYDHFVKPQNLLEAAEFAKKHPEHFDAIEQQLDIPREVVIAILFVESRFGAHTGNHMVLYRLSRVASVRSPGNVEENFLRLRKIDETVSLDEVESRSRYLEDTFYQEVVALFAIARRNKIDPMKVKGSTAGAFGWPQFLPSTFLKYGRDGDRNGFVSLYSPIDAMWSVATYLSGLGYHRKMTREEQGKIIWHYNRSDAYVNSVLDVAAGIRRVLAHG